MIHVGFRARAIIALGDLLEAICGGHGAQEHVGYRQAEGHRRKHERLDASARPRPAALDGEADDLGLQRGLPICANYQLVQANGMSKPRSSSEGLTHRGSRSKPAAQTARTGLATISLFPVLAPSACTTPP